MSTLRIDYKNDILDTTQNEYRVYDIVNEDGDVVQSNVHLEDKTVYTQQGDNFGAGDMNDQNTEINQLNSNLTANSQPFRFGYDSVSGKYGYILNQGGADTVIPFSSGITGDSTSELQTTYVNPHTFQEDGFILPYIKNNYSESKIGYVHLIRDGVDLNLGNFNIVGGAEKVWYTLYEVKAGDVIKIIAQSGFETTFFYVGGYFFSKG